MITVTQKELNKVIEAEWNYLVSKVDKWSLLYGEQDMEILEHVLRCILHVGNTTDYANDFIECSKVQNSDGGWSKESHENKTSIWITTFVALKLCRGNLTLQNPKVEESIQKALKYILSSQKEDGHWSDVEWSHLDTTCSVTVFLTVYQVTHDENKEYDSAILSYKQIARLSLATEQEKIEREIESLEDKIFEQVKKSNLMGEYLGFLKKYPRSHKNSDEARLWVERRNRSEQVKKTEQLRF